MLVINLKSAVFVLRDWDRSISMTSFSTFLQFSSELNSLSSFRMNVDEDFRVCDVVALLEMKSSSSESLKSSSILGRIMLLERWNNLLVRFLELEHEGSEEPGKNKLQYYEQICYSIVSWLKKKSSRC